MRFLRELYLIPVYLYKALLSPFFSSHVCLYTPTCSTYMVTAVRRFGIIKGTIMGLARLFRCNRRFMGGDDPVPEVWSRQAIKDGYTLFKRH
jgi:putative membrane protein insertion efficiency factor